MKTLLKIVAATLLASVAIAAIAAEGDLDPTFGAAGKLQIAAAASGAVGSNFVATDVASQSNGKLIVAGYSDNACVLARLNTDGSLDSSFGGSNGFSPGFAGYGLCTFTSIAVRPDDRIVVAGNSPNGVAEVSQFTANGLPEGSSFSTVFINPSSGDSTTLSRLVLDSDGSINAAGTYYDNQGGLNGNQFLLVRISADGHTVERFQYPFGSGPNQDDHALDMAIDSQGRYVVVGYHRGAAGNYDFAAIRVRHDLTGVDSSFGSAGQTTVAFDKGGDNGDFCNAVAIFKSSGFIELGGHATATVGTGTYQAAALATLDSNGNLWHYFAGDLYYPAQLVFSFNGNPNPGHANDVQRLVIDGYNSKDPQLLVVGSGNQYGTPYGEMFGIARMNPFPNFNFDTSFNGNGIKSVYFAERPAGFGTLTTTNFARSGSFAAGKVTAVGFTAAAAGNQMAITRLAAFDGILKNGFDSPSY